MNKKLYTNPEILYTVFSSNTDISTVSGNNVDGVIPSEGWTPGTDLDG